jgi:hypothetical protein
MSFITIVFFCDHAIVELMNKIAPSKKGLSKLNYVMSPKAVVGGSGERIEWAGDRYK